MASARLLDGKQLAATLQAEIAREVAALVQSHGVKPGLAAVLIGENPASQSYVRGKRRACENVGMASWLHELPVSVSQGSVLQLVAQLNADPAVHGILIQLPLPPQLDEATLIRSVSPDKDVDGFHPENYGLLAAAHPRFVPCTPLGIHRLLTQNGIPLSGAHVVVLGRSNIVGKPLALLLMQKGIDATVTVCHSRSRQLADLTRQADVIVAAIGQTHFLKANMVRPGVVVVDVGMNRLNGKPTGDVDFDAVREVASAITPVPGGVGPLTITMLLHNTLQAARALAAR
jgi:methylenetetrahydrofolate dehydrogenase (NADP+)/methenyltetrahydrofolate cyclohydrolase